MICTNWVFVNFILTPDLMWVCYIFIIHMPKLWRISISSFLLGSPWVVEEIIIANMVCFLFPNDWKASPRNNIYLYQCNFLQNYYDIVSFNHVNNLIQAFDPFDVIILSSFGAHSVVCDIHSCIALAVNLETILWSLPWNLMQLRYRRLQHSVHQLLHFHFVYFCIFHFVFFLCQILSSELRFCSFITFWKSSINPSKVFGSPSSHLSI